MKYSVAGHGAVQEVDNVHSAIENVLDVNEYFSPPGLIALLKEVNPKNPMNIMEMESEDFKDYKHYGTQHYNFAKVPFTKVRVIKFTQSLDVKYCVGYDESESLNISVQLVKGTQENKLKNSMFSLKIVSKVPELSDIKKKHLILMFEYMSTADIQYYESVCKLNRSQLAKLKKTTQPKSTVSTRTLSEITDSDRAKAEVGPPTKTCKKQNMISKIRSKNQVTTAAPKREASFPKKIKTDPDNRKTKANQKRLPKSTAHISETTVSKHKEAKASSSTQLKSTVSTCTSFELTVDKVSPPKKTCKKQNLNNKILSKCRSRLRHQNV